MKEKSFQVNVLATDNPASPKGVAGAKSKKAYEKPRVIYRAPLEAMAAVCTGQYGKATGYCLVASS